MLRLHAEQQARHEFQVNVSAVGIFLVLRLGARRGRPATVITPRRGSEKIIHSIGTEN